MSQSDTSLLIYGREKGKIIGWLQKQQFCCFPAMSKSSKFPNPKIWFGIVLKLLLIVLAGWQFSLFISALSIFEEGGKNF